MRKITLPILLLAFSAILQAQLTDSQANSVLDTALSTAYVSLHTSDPGDSCTNEVTGGSYARLLTAFDSAASSATANTAAISYAGMPAETVTHIAVWSAVSGGTCKMRGALDSPVAVGAGQTFEIAAGDLDIVFN